MPQHQPEHRRVDPPQRAERDDRVAELTPGRRLAQPEPHPGSSARPVGGGAGRAAASRSTSRSRHRSNRPTATPDRAMREERDQPDHDQRAAARRRRPAPISVAAVAAPRTTPEIRYATRPPRPGRGEEPQRPLAHRLPGVARHRAGTPTARTTGAERAGGHARLRHHPTVPADPAAHGSARATPWSRPGARAARPAGRLARTHDNWTEVADAARLWAVRRTYGSGDAAGDRARRRVDRLRPGHASPP